MPHKFKPFFMGVPDPVTGERRYPFTRKWKCPKCGAANPTDNWRCWHCFYHRQSANEGLAKTAAETAAL